MTAQTDADRDPIKLLQAGRTVAGFASRPLASLKLDELGRFESALLTLMFGVWAEGGERKDALQVPRGRAGIRLAAVNGKLTAAGRRSVQARRAARARWRRSS